MASTEPQSMAEHSMLNRAARRRVRQFSSQVRQLSDLDAPVPNLAWTTGDLARHVACLPSFWHSHNEAGDVFVRPADFARYSDEQRAHITESDPSRLADLIDTNFDDFLDGLSADHQHRWLYGVRTNTDNLCGLTLNETILHGRDLAAVTGATPPMFERFEANGAVEATMATAPCFVDEARAHAQPDGVYHLRFRGGNDYTWTKQGGELRIERKRPARADARLNADPATYLLASLGRIGQIQASISGKMIVYGRRPWRFLGLGTIIIDGV